MEVRLKRFLIYMCVLALVLTGCGGEKESSEATATPAQGKQYKGDEIVQLPEECFADNGELLTTDLQVNQQGEPALYQMLEGADDDGEERAAIMEYTLNGDGNWQKKEICKKQLLKRLWEETQYILDFPYIQRGDDGNLYVLMRSSDGEQGVDRMMGQPPAEDRFCEYSLLVVDEGNDSFREVKLQTKVTTDEGMEVDYAKEYDDVTSFHVKEDGTVFLVFSGASAMWFDSATGTQTNFCPTIADSAFGKNVAYGESQMMYYSSAHKLFGILDSDTLAVSSHFGKEIPEEDRKYEWYFDTDTTTWQTYAFNESGLYLLNDSGKKASAIRLSEVNSFETLADAHIYDILVRAGGTLGEELYVLLQRENTDSSAAYESEGAWECGIVKYCPQKK